MGVLDGLFDIFDDEPEQPTESYKEGQEKGNDESVIGGIFHDLGDLGASVIPSNPSDDVLEFEAGYHDARDEGDDNDDDEDDESYDDED